VTPNERTDLKHGHIGQSAEHIDEHDGAATGLREDEAGSVEAWGAGEKGELRF
jgi:hypothetical protein